MTKLSYAVVVGASLLGACGGSDGVSIDELPTYVADTECSIQVECQQAPDEASCKAGFALDDTQSLTIIADVKAGIIKYDEKAAKACFDAAAAGHCAFQGTHAKDNDPCATYLTGTVATGGACFVDLECADAGNCTPTMSSCDQNTTCCPGTCAAGTPAKEVALGAACASTSECPVDGYCKGLTSTAMGTCTAVVTTAGAACDSILACANNMICNMSSSTAGTCYDPPANGATCDPTFFIPDFACSDSRDYCDPTSMKCTARVAVGGTCSDTVLCLGFADCINTKCVAKPKIGEACDAQNGAGCLAGTCTNSVCTKDATGMSCR